MRKSIFCFLIVVSLGLAPGMVLASPKAVPAQPVYQFEPVPEGKGLTHDFVIKNTGDALLNILSVVPP